MSRSTTAQTCSANAVHTAPVSKSTANEKLIRARTRVMVAGLAGLATFAAAALLGPWQVAVLLGWDVMALVFTGWVWWSVWRMDGAATERRSKTEDASRAAADVVLISASVASLGGVGFALLKAGTETGTPQAWITTVAVVSVAISWIAVHTVFTLRYAHLYYLEGGGIDFDDEVQPDYRDFAYVAFTIGMTYQVSDTDITSRAIRMAVLRHALLSYLFSIAVIAMTINVVAGLLNH
jgi:uncharacterized membrane protein